MKEKDIEKAIVKYLQTTGWIVESMQWGSVMIKKGWYNHRMTLNSKGCPDILYYKDNQLYGIEVKKNEKAVYDWYNLLDRYNGEWKKV